jgi:hypothetical protein
MIGILPGLRNSPIVPNVALVREAVCNKAKVSFFNVLEIKLIISNLIRKKSLFPIIKA